MKIGIDLDDTLMKYPEQFKKLVIMEHMTNANSNLDVEIFIVSNRGRKAYRETYKPKLKELGIDVDRLNDSLMDEGQMDGPAPKARMAEQCDIVFDDHGDIFAPLVKTNTMICKVL